MPSAPSFSRENYDFWAIKMEFFLMASDLWEIVVQWLDTYFLYFLNSRPTKRI